MVSNNISSNSNHVQSSPARAKETTLKNKKLLVKTEADKNEKKTSKVSNTLKTLGIAGVVGSGVILGLIASRIGQQSIHIPPNPMEPPIGGFMPQGQSSGLMNAIGQQSTGIPPNPMDYPSVGRLIPIPKNYI